MAELLGGLTPDQHVAGSRPASDRSVSRSVPLSKVTNGQAPQYPGVNRGPDLRVGVIINVAALSGRTQD